VNFPPLGYNYKVDYQRLYFIAYLHNFIFVTKLDENRHSIIY